MDKIALFTFVAMMLGLAVGGVICDKIARQNTRAMALPPSPHTCEQRLDLVEKQVKDLCSYNVLAGCR